MSFPAAILKSHAVRVAVAAATLVAGSAQASAVEQSQTFQFQIGVVIPVKCRLEFSAPATSGGAGNPIVLREFCNSRSGYQVLASYDQQEMLGARVVLDGQQFDLDDGGQTLLVDSNVPDITAKQFAFLPASQSQLGGSLSLSITPKV